MKFIYIDSNKSKKQKIEINIDNIQVPVIELKVLTNKTLQAEPAYFHREWQSCNWQIVDENGKLESGLFHERFYTPLMEKPSTEYWLCDSDFKTPEEACIEIVKRGCDPNKFWAKQHFYTQIDGEGCFIITTDFDEALKFYGYKFEEGEPTMILTRKEALEKIQFCIDTESEERLVERLMVFYNNMSDEVLKKALEEEFKTFVLISSE